MELKVNWDRGEAEFGEGIGDVQKFDKALFEIGKGVWGGQRQDGEVWRVGVGQVLETVSAVQAEQLGFQFHSKCQFRVYAFQFGEK